MCNKVFTCGTFCYKFQLCVSEFGVCVDVAVFSLPTLTNIYHNQTETEI